MDYTRTAKAKADAIARRKARQIKYARPLPIAVIAASIGARKVSA